MSESIPKYVLVQRHITEAIDKKRLVDKLPGERTLAKELGYSYMTIRKAIENLVNQGVLYKVQTKGTFVNHNKSSKPKSRTIGYFLDSSIKQGISSPYYSLVFNAIVKEAAKSRYSVVYFCEINEDELQRKLAKLDGIIATCFPRVEDTIAQFKQNLPVVVIDNSAADRAIPSVIVDNYTADIESVDCLFEMGHERIGFMTGTQDSEIGKNRYAGYQTGLAKNGLSLREELVFRGDYSFEAGVRGAEYFLSQEEAPTAIICANDSMALGAMQKFNKEGFAVPDDISIVGFDDIEVASQITPSLTTVAAPIQDIAKHSVSMLKTMIQGKSPEFQHISLPAHLVKRQTCRKLKDPVAA